jgi:hypothetical protein
MVLCNISPKELEIAQPLPLSLPQTVSSVKEIHSAKMTQVYTYVQSEYEETSEGDDYDEEEIRNQYLTMAAEYILQCAPLIVIQKEWDLPETWNIPPYGEMVKKIIDSSLDGLNEAHILSNLVSPNLLRRDLFFNTLDIPGAIQAELDILVDGFKYHPTTKHFIETSLIHSQSHRRALQSVMDFDLSDRMFCAAWEIYFQVLEHNTGIELRSPEIREQSLKRLAFSSEHIILQPEFDGGRKFSIEDRIIMWINGTYPDLITLCLKALQLHQNGEKLGSSQNQMVNSIHSQIVDTIQSRAKN